MKIKTTAIALMLPAILWLHGCAEMPSNAPVFDRTPPGQKPARADTQKPQDAAAPVLPDPPGFYTVKKGDTLTRIAQQFNAGWRDLAEWNVLANPNDIKIGQQLRVVPPEGARAVSVPVDTGLEMSVVPAEGAKPPAQPAAPADQAPRPSSSLKRGPIGTKVAYTDQTWSEMQRGDAPHSADAPRPAEAPKPAEAAKPAEVAKPAEPPKPAEAPRKPDAAAAARFIWPTEGKLIRKFDPATKGIDISGQPGQPVVAVGDGTVLYAKGMRGYGNLVIIDHSEGLVSAYAHNKTILVREGQTVTRGQRVAEMGDSDAESVRLHFEIRQLGKPVDPISLLPSR